MTTGPTLDWTAPEAFTVADESFVCGYGASTPEALCVRKPPALVERIVSILREVEPRRMVELGIAQGGSIALSCLVSDPERLVAFELSKHRIEPLDRFLARRNLTDRVDLHYGTDQGDGLLLRDRVNAATGGADLDLVIDDASHRYAETRASFEALFPLLRPGGLFVIEDWGWQLRGRRLFGSLEDGIRAREAAGTESEPFGGTRRGSYLRVYLENADQVPLVRFAAEILMAQACATEAIASVHADQAVCIVERGPIDLDPETFRISNHYADYSDHRGMLRELRLP